MDKTVELADGCVIVVPDTLNLITSYVLEEQRDWFEDEIRFVRKLLSPGDKVIDIGANYGVYTLSMARAVGPSGRIWAFEPTSSTAKSLTKSIVANGFGNVIVDQRGVSQERATLHLSLNDNSELNEIVRAPNVAMNGATELIEVASLDELSEQYGWTDIAFMKIDAEGEESRIIRGGRKFFANNSPLVQYEVKAGPDLHMELVEEFRSIGYAPYRLIPGLNLLAPLADGESVDAFLLNLFGCKADCAEKLAAQGRLVGKAVDASWDLPSVGHDLLRRWNADGRFGWRTSLAGFSFARELHAAWVEMDVPGHNETVERAIALFSISGSSEVPPLDRYRALRCSFELMNALCAEEPGFMRRATLARIALGFGARVVAVEALRQLFESFMTTQQINLGEPFLAASDRFEQISPGTSMDKWLMGSTLEEFEKWSHYSSFYAGSEAFSRLAAIQQFGFASEEMLRRLALVSSRSGVRQN